LEVRVSRLEDKIRDLQGYVGGNEEALKKTDQLIARNKVEEK